MDCSVLRLCSEGYEQILMETKLDKLLKAIDPEMTIETCFRRADNAVNTFAFRCAQIDKWDKFTECMGELLRHLYYHILRMKKPHDAPVSEFWPKCAHILIILYGINGERTAFDITRTGNEGGLYSVVKNVTMWVAEDFSKNEVSAKISAYWRNLSIDEQIDASTEYIAKFGHLLPSELTEESALRIRMNLPKFLNKHPYLIKQTRQVGR